MLKKVIVPLDGSGLAAAALGPGRALTEATGAQLLLMTTRWDNDVGKAREYLEEQAASLGTDGVETAIVHDRGAPEAILLESRDPGTVVCMATHGRGGLGQAILGSVAEAVVRGSDGPLLLVGPSVERGAWQLAHWFANGNLLLPVDGSTTSEAIVPIAADWAGMLGLRAWVVQVTPPTGRLVEPRGIAATSAYVRSVAKRMQDTGAPAQWEVLHGHDAAGAILWQANRLPATLVAMATHGRSGLARVAMGSVAMRVVHGSTCPVLVVRPADLIA